MLFVPIPSSLEIEVNVEREVAKRTLAARVSEKIFSLFPPNVFVGTVNKTGFDIKEAVWYPRTFNPRFRGVFYSTGDGTIVRVSASNGYATLTVVTGWLLAAWVLGITFSRLLRGEYSSAGIGILLCACFVACTFFTARLYDKKLRDGMQKLGSILQGPQIYEAAGRQGDQLDSGR